MKTKNYRQKLREIVKKIREITRKKKEKRVRASGYLNKVPFFDILLPKKLYQKKIREITKNYENGLQT